MPLMKSPKIKPVEKLFKVSQNRPIIELFKFFGWTTTTLCGNLNQPEPKTDTKLYKISQNRSMIVNFLNFSRWTVAHPPAHKGSASEYNPLINKQVYNTTEAIF
jgi:hypothetical protein